MSPPFTCVRVRTGAPYDVVIGPGARTQLPEISGSWARRMAVVHPPAVRTLAEDVSSGLTRAGAEVSLVTVPDGEAAKTIEVAASCWSQLAAMGLTRSDTVVSVGGGATSDLAGFVAATWLRGVRVVHLPTTLLGMVDAAIGGKCAINTAAGKNLVGTIWEPAAVLCDLDVLAALPRPELVSGFAEVVKCGFLADPAILELIEADPQAATAPGGAVLRELVERSVRVKADIVSADLRETADQPGRVTREVLNYGHTLGHAIERVESFGIRHGHAVAVGMVFAAELARVAGRLDQATSERHRRVLASLDLPTSYNGAGWPALRQAMAADKKARAGRLRFVVLDGLARPSVLDDPDPGWLAEAHARVVVDERASGTR